jgi:hypothetical protein
MAAGGLDRTVEIDGQCLDLRLAQQLDDGLAREVSRRFSTHSSSQDAMVLEAVATSGSLRTPQTRVKRAIEVVVEAAQPEKTKDDMHDQQQEHRGAGRRSWFLPDGGNTRELWPATASF